MRKIRHFKCKDCGVFEDFVKDEQKEANCACGKKSPRIISSPRYLSNSTGRSPARHK